VLIGDAIVKKLIAIALSVDENLETRVRRAQRPLAKPAEVT
jgi:hypothetical protein